MEIVWDPNVVHSQNKAKQAQTSLLISVYIFPAHVESVNLPLPSCLKSSGLTAVQQCAQITGCVDLDLGILRHLFFD